MTTALCRRVRYQPLRRQGSPRRAPAIENMRVDHGRPNIRVTQQLLDRPTYRSHRPAGAWQRNASAYGTQPVLDLGRIHGQPHRPLHHGLMERVTLTFTARGVKNHLPPDR
jgi:hypothetical protein